MSKKVIPRSKLIGMQVYNPDATLVGTVKDVGLVPGETGAIVLIVTTKYQQEVEIEWAKVAEVGDIILLSEPIEISPPSTAVTPTVEAKPKVEAAPTVTPTPGPGAAPTCPTCGKPATWIPQYKRWYCYNCRKYL